MTESAAEVLPMPALGAEVRLARSSDPPDASSLTFEVLGRPRGFVTQAHVHTRQAERHEVLAGEMRLELAGTTHVLRAGEQLEVPAGTPHRQLPSGSGPGHVRVTVTPAGRTREFLERLAELCASGQMLRSGFPRPLAAARLVRDFADEGHATMPPLAVQRPAATAILALERVRSHAWREYAFVDEWDVAAPRAAVFDALADGRTYPAWWRPVYIDVDADEGPPAVGHESRQHFKGRLPYHLHTRSRITRLQPPGLIEADVVGDLRGHGVWTLTETHAGTHVRFDWTVHADRRLLAALTPLLRPLLRWNHSWAIARAVEGLEPYAQAAAVSPDADRA